MKRLNRKGFTLIEVIVVIVIIVLLSLILIPNVMLFVSKNNKDMCYKLKDNIESAAKMYVNENKYELGFECVEPNNSKEINLSTLIDSGKISSPVINPVTNKPVSNDDVKVEVKYDCGTKNFTYKVSGINCE